MSNIGPAYLRPTTKPKFVSLKLVFEKQINKQQVKSRLVCPDRTFNTIDNLKKKNQKIIPSKNTS